ncbi:MAG: glycosyltransferase family protein [Candidatus Methanoperedens sp.]|nr:glycosyltransferase family protein [Candidatus Methanoperedens sp.]
MLNRIYFSVCGEGYGHSSRDMAIAGILEKKGVEVLLGSYGYVLERLKSGFKTIEIEREFEMAGNNGYFDLAATISQNKRTVFRFPKIISEEKKILEEFNATCVVADGRTAAVFAAHKLGIPCIIIANQTTIEPFFKDRPLYVRLIGKTLQFTFNNAMKHANLILIPDFPPPDTVCLNTLSKSRDIMKKQKFMGPVVSVNNDPPNPHILPGMEHPFILTILGGHSFRRPIFDSILKVAEKLPDINFIILTKFSNTDQPENVRIIRFADNIAPYMKNAEMIITQAGHSTAMEIMTLGKKCLIIPDKGQVEQETNAARMKELGVCETIDYLSLDPENLFKKIHMLMNGPEFNHKSSRFSGTAKILNHIYFL